MKNLLLYLVPQQQKHLQERTLSEIQHAYESLNFLARMKETTEKLENHDTTFDVRRSFNMDLLFHVVVLIESVTLLFPDGPERLRLKNNGCFLLSRLIFCLISLISSIERNW